MSVFVLVTLFCIYLWSWCANRLATAHCSPTLPWSSDLPVWTARCTANQASWWMTATVSGYSGDTLPSVYFSTLTYNTINTNLQNFEAVSSCSSDITLCSLCRYLHITGAVPHGPVLKKGRFCAEVSQLFASFKVSDTSSLAVHGVSIKAGKNATKCLTADLAAHGGGKPRPAHSNMQLPKAYLFTLPLPRLLPPVFVIVCVCVFKICCCLCHLSLLFTDIVDSCWSVFTCYAICDFSAVLHELLPLVSRRITKFYLLFFVSSGSL